MLAVGGDANLQRPRDARVPKGPSKECREDSLGGAMAGPFTAGDGGLLQALSAVPGRRRRCFPPGSRRAGRATREGRGRQGRARRRGRAANASVQARCDSRPARLAPHAPRTESWPPHTEPKHVEKGKRVYTSVVYGGRSI